MYFKLFSPRPGRARALIRLMLLALILAAPPAALAGEAGPEAAGPPRPASIYDRPYSLLENDINRTSLKRNTMLLFGAGVGAMGILYLMPTSVTNWDDDDDGSENPFKKWWKNVTHGPVWDNDDLWLNYVTHPWAGAIYYMGARSSGANAAYSFGYSFALSTFFWECGIEAFAEIPSIQDLIVTPVTGAILGEGFYLAKRHIVENDYRLLGSRALGVGAALLMDPISEVTGYFFDDDAKEKHNLVVYGAPLISGDGKFGYQLSFSLTF